MKLANFSNISIKNKFILILLIQMMILLAWYIYMLFISINDNNNTVMNKAQQTNHQIMSNLKSNILCMENISTFPLIRSTAGETNLIYNYLSGNNTDENKEYEYNHYINNRFSELLSMYSSIIDQVYLFDMNGYGMRSNISSRYAVNVHYNVHDKWVKEVLHAFGKPVLLSSFEVQKITDTLVDNHLYLARAIVNAEKYKAIGIVLVGTDLNDITYKLKDAQSQTGYKYGLYTFAGKLIFGTPIVNSHEIKLLSNQNSQSATIFNSHIKKINGKNFSANYGVDCTHQIISIAELPLANRSLGLRQYGFWIMLAVLFISSIVVMGLILKSTLNPIVFLVKACQTIIDGRFDVKVPAKGPIEIKELSIAFNRMTEKIGFLINEVYLYDIEKRDLELQMLRNQINPHFIYNTLESMHMVAYLKNADNLAEMCVLLGKILRYGVTAPNEEVTVQDEISNLNDYIRLQMLLYADRCNFIVNIEDSITNKAMIKLILQPIVENAIYHGIASLADKGRITVLGYQQADSIIFKITDNGQGIDGETLQKLNGYLEGNNNSFKSIGLKNVHRRIRLYYGEKYGLHIDSVKGKGTSVTANLPIHFAPEHAIANIK